MRNISAHNVHVGRRFRNNQCGNAYRNHKYRQFGQYHGNCGGSFEHERSWALGARKDFSVNTTPERNPSMKKYLLHSGFCNTRRIIGAGFCPTALFPTLLFIFLGLSATTGRDA
jgi:hypothetical protein